jgi:hypothetical protein
MPMLLLLRLSLSRVLEYAPGPSSALPPRDSPTLVLYYATDTGAHQRELVIFNRASALLFGADFLTVNCSAHFDWCVARQIEPLPLIQLFSHPKHKPIDMTNEHAPYAIVDFAASNSLARSMIPPSTNLKSLDESEWAQFVTQNKWRIVTFMNPIDRASQLLYPTARELADIFAEESDMVFALVNCTGNYSFCHSLDVRAAPLVRVYEGPVWVDYDGYRELEFLLPWLNRRCRKGRRFDGAMEVRKTIEEFETVLREFLTSSNMTKFIEEFQPTEGQEIYLPAMNKIAKNGVGSLRQDITNCLKLLRSPHVVHESRARVEEQLHVLKQIKQVLATIEGKQDL